MSEQRQFIRPNTRMIAVVGKELPPNNGHSRWIRQVMPVEFWVTDDLYLLRPVCLQNGTLVVVPSSDLFGVAVEGTDPYVVNDTRRRGIWEDSREVSSPPSMLKEGLLEKAEQLLGSRQKLDPGNVWGECLCSQISQQDQPCLTCRALEDNNDIIREVRAFLGLALNMPDVRE